MYFLYISSLLLLITATVCAVIFLIRWLLKKDIKRIRLFTRLALGIGILFFILATVWSDLSSGLLVMAVLALPTAVFLQNIQQTMKSWDEWLRRRFRCYIWKQWKRTFTRKKAFVQLGMAEWPAWEIAKSRKAYWRMAKVLNTAISKERLARAGYYSILDRYESVHRIYG